MLHSDLDQFVREPIHINPNEQDLEFQVVDWHAIDLGDEECQQEIREIEEAAETEGGESGSSTFSDPRKYHIYLFGVTSEGQSVCAKVTGFQPFFYVRLPKNNYKQVGMQLYRLLQKQNYNHQFEYRGPSHYHPWSSGLVKLHFVERYDVDAGFTNNENFPFLQFIFNSQAAMKKCWTMIRNIQKPPWWAKKKRRRQSNADKMLERICHSVKLYESNLDPMLRFMHMRDIKSTGWAQVKKGGYVPISYQNRESFCQIEIEVDWESVYPNNDNHTVAPIRQASFDIECYSHDGKVPKPEHPENKCIQIATAIKDYGDDDFFVKHLLTLGPCDPIEGAVVDVCKTEAELLQKWMILLQKLDPDIIIGYNIFGFDLNYVMVRAEQTGCLNNFAFLSKLRDYQSKVEKKSLKSKAYGANYYMMVPMPGRFQLDLYPHIKKEQKYTSYKLGFVAEEILKETKHDVKPKEIFEGFASGDVKRITRIGAYCVQDTLLPQRIIDKMNILLNLIEMGKVTYVPLSYLINRGQQIKVFSHVAKTAREKGYLLPHVFIDRSRDDEGVKRMKVNVKGKLGKLDEDEEEMEDEEETYEGATVLKPLSGFYDEPVSAEDFKALYPTTEIDWNFCWTTLVKNYLKYGRLPGVPYHEVFIPLPPPAFPKPNPMWENLVQITMFEGAEKVYITLLKAIEESDIQEAFLNKLKTIRNIRKEKPNEIVPYLCKKNAPRDQWSVPIPEKGNMVSRLYRKYPGANTRKMYLWAQNTQGLMPKVLIHLLSARSKAKKEMAAAKNPFMRSVYDGKQLALKVCCNSVYGFTGAVHTGMLPCKPVAECTTTRGREMIENSKNFAENIENFRELMQYKDFFPAEYPYICRKNETKCFITYIKGLLELFELDMKQIEKEVTGAEGGIVNYDLQLPSDVDTFELYTTERFSTVNLLSVKKNNVTKEGLIFKFHTDIGKIMNVQVYDATVIYGDTDSIFTRFRAPHLPDLERKIAYNMILGAYVADRITEYLRSFNIYKADSEKWTELEYEKVYGNLLLFTKKRYTGTLYEFNPIAFEYIDKKGVALKRRDFCPLVKELYYSCLKILFDEKLGAPQKRLEIATKLVQSTIRDLLNNKIELEKLIISNSLADQYSIQEKKQKKGRTDTFNKNNVFVNDLIVIDHKKYGLIEGKVIEKNDFNKVTYFNRENFEKPLSVFFDLEEFTGHIGVEFSEIRSRSKYMLPLKKIIDPKTDERELEPMKRAHVRLVRKMYGRDPGSAPVSGERVPFLFVTTPPKPKGQETLQWEKAEHPDYAIEKKLKPDPLYYLDRQLRNPIEQIFSLLMEDPNILFDPLIREYNNRQNRQGTISGFFGGNTLSADAVPISKSKKRGRGKSRTKAEKPNPKKMKQTGLTDWCQK